MRRKPPSPAQKARARERRKEELMGERNFEGRGKGSRNGPDARQRALAQGTRWTLGGLWAVRQPRLLSCELCHCQCPVLRVGSRSHLPSPMSYYFPISTNYLAVMLSQGSSPAVTLIYSGTRLKHSCTTGLLRSGGSIASLAHSLTPLLLDYGR